jgi:pimeloyl-ACP methyl ester carboxylesterase
MPTPATYEPRRVPASALHAVRGIAYHVLQWGDASMATPERPPLIMLHGWMDVGASFQFVVDALAAAEGFERWVIAPDWRGFGHTHAPAGTDSYWFADYLGDLDALLPALGIHGAIDLVGHSMGGNVAMLYAGVRPGRIRRLVNLEGFGMPETQPDDAPRRLEKWLDALAEPQTLRDYASVDDVAARLLKNNPLLTPDKAAWLAPHWSEPQADGRWHILGDPAHKRPNPVLSRRAETLAVWRRIAAPVLWVEGNLTDVTKWWGDRYPRSDFEARLAEVPGVQRVTLEPCGHMLHHDQPEALAGHLARFLG